MGRWLAIVWKSGATVGALMGAWLLLMSLSPDGSRVFSVPVGIGLGWILHLIHSHPSSRQASKI